MTKIRTLRTYQEDLICKAIAHLDCSKGLLLEMCVGSGKTLTALVLAKWLTQEGVIDRVWVVAPMVDIRDQWAEFSEVRVLPNSKSSFLWGSKTAYLDLLKVSIAESKKDFLTKYQDTPNKEHPVVVTTYNLLWSTFETVKNDHRQLLSRTLVIIDEGHHVFAEKDKPRPHGTADCIHKARECEAKTLQLTGTPARYDNKAVLFTDDAKISWSFLDQMLEGFAPSLTSQVITVCDQGESDDLNILVPARENETQAFQNLVKDLEYNARIKSALSGIRVRCTKGKLHRATVRGMKAAIQAVGLRALVYVPPSVSKSDKPEDKIEWEIDQTEWAQDQVLFKEMLRKMKAEEPYEELKKIADVVIFLRKADEGLDIPAFNNMYFWGIPRSLPTIVQVIGRCLRWRLSGDQPLFKGYPDEWLRMSRVVFCVTKDRLKAYDDAVLMHQLGGWLSSIEIGEVLGSLTRLIDGIPTKDGNKSNAVRKYSSDVNKYQEDGSRYVALAEVEFQSFQLDLLDSIDDHTKQEILAKLAIDQAKEDPDCLIPENLQEKVLKVILGLSYRGSNKEVHRKTAETLSDDPKVQEVIRNALQDFTKQTLQARQETFSKWLIDGEVQKHYVELGRKTGASWRLDEQAEKAETFQKLHNRWPGSEGVPASQDLVPGEAFSFGSFRKDWKARVTQRHLEAYSLEDDARREWLIKAWRVWQNDKALQFRALSRALGGPLGVSCLPPLLAYYLDALWIPPEAQWTRELSLEELRTLGNLIFLAAGKPKRLNPKAKHVGRKILGYVQANSVQDLKALLIRKDLSPALIDTEVVA